MAADPGATVETWQANAEGHYENQQPDRQPDFNLRGVFVADAAAASTTAPSSPRATRCRTTARSASFSTASAIRFAGRHISTS